MTAWAPDDLQRIGDATELQLASRRPDGGQSGNVTMWVVRIGDDIYVRSAGGPDRPWYRRAIASGDGRIRAGGVEADVTFDTGSVDAPLATIDAEYHDKYDRYGPGPVSHVTGTQNHRVTIRLIPRDTEQEN